MHKTMFLFLLFASLCRAQTANDYRVFVQRSEGYEESPYADPSGKGFCVGIGHHITKDDDYAEFYSKSQIDYLFARDLETALCTARFYIKNFDSLPPLIKKVVVGVQWTVGPTGFGRFHKFCDALSRRDYNRAADELESSKWAHQVSSSRVQMYEYDLRLQVQ